MDHVSNVISSSVLCVQQLMFVEPVQSTITWSMVHVCLSHVLLPTAQLAPKTMYALNASLVSVLLPN